MFVPEREEVMGRFIKTDFIAVLVFKQCQGSQIKEYEIGGGCSIHRSYETFLLSSGS
jgi:hypothetical protein